MKARLLVLFLSLFVCAFPAAGQAVIESDSNVTFRDNVANVSLTIETTGARRNERIELALLDTDSVARATSTQIVRLIPGKKSYVFSIPVGNILTTSSDEIAWWRLQYRVGGTTAIASLSELLKDDFNLRASSFQRVVPGEPFRVRIRSLQPFSERPVKGVVIKAELVLDLDIEADDDELKIKASGRTDGDGFANIDFKIPADVKLDDDPEISIVGQKNGVVRKIEEILEDDNSSNGTAVLTTDKPLYQPGQTFNVRALLLDMNNTVVPDSELEFKIKDEDGTTVFQQSVKTSVFGIAAVSWPIPESSKLGNYAVEIEADFEIGADRLPFKVSRYDLPNFSVATQSDKTYYLPTDSEARVTVTADYLFGKPVTSGKVRVVQESDREWNYREQKYDVKEGASVEGAADKEGKFVAKLDLNKEIAELKANEWRRFKDISFAAYYTDITTNRTEQRRFDIRITKEPIHIYLVRYATQHPDLPLTAYVSTFYADGTPAESNVEIRDTRNVLDRFKTNRLGAGKFEIDIPRDRPDQSEIKIRIKARDKNGLEGTFDEDFEFDKDDAVRISTARAIYKPGETIELDILSSQQSGFIYVDVVKAWSPVDSRVVRLHNGKAHILIPYRPSFKGDLVIAAYSDKQEGRWNDSMRTVRGVIFPEQQNLLINAKFSKDVYRPSEDATVRFSVLDGSRKPIESAIGLGIFDKAIEERARTDSEFGSGYISGFYSLMGYDRSFGSLTLKDLNELDLSQPIKPEIQLAAEVMLAGNWYFPTVYHSDNMDSEAKSVYGDAIQKQINPVSTALQTQYDKNYEHPIDQQSLAAILARSSIDLAKLLDPWGQPYVAEFSINRTHDIASLKNAGPDKRS